MTTKTCTLRERMFTINSYTKAACFSMVDAQPDGSCIVEFRDIPEDYYFNIDECSHWSIKEGNYYVMFDGNYNNYVVLTPDEFMEEYVPLEDQPTLSTV